VSKEPATYQPTQDERADFDYYWQHLRRNFGYCMAVGGIGWNEMWYQTSPKGRTRHKLFHQRREFDASCLLPTPVAAGAENSDEALREVLKRRPNFFQTPQWQTIKAKASAAEPVAFWNLAGPHRCAWRDYHDGKKYSDRLWKDPRQDYYEHHAFRKDPHHPERHKVGEEFAHLHISLEIKEQEAGDLERIKCWARQHGRTVEDERKVRPAEHEEARARMKRFLEAHPRMDFVADTRLPWATVSRAMESEWERIKDLRERVGLKRNEQPARKRQWRTQLAVYDAHFPHWLKNRKKIAALPRIWRENLGFQESFGLLGIELTPEAGNLAQKLDKQGLKPKRVFKFADKYRHALERASYAEAATRGLSGTPKPKRGSGAIGVFDDQGHHASVVEFDYGAVDALLEGGEVPDVEPGISSERNEADLKTLQSWRSHFSIPKPQLPANLAKMDADKLREWFTVARLRIESLWPSTDYYDEI
jgi:hypothetical protein